MTIKIEVRYFAALREQLGAAQSLELAQAASVGELRDLLIASSSQHAQALSRAKALRCALNKNLCAETALLSDGDELAFFPPVTGG
ncbi:molybdopterin converting factor subunit 1 [Roseateles sp. PN1]|uniref:molybdopterin converting factor subunit 1 n=1 Tax=Roseateles sp. PN1 TaxID=3137372 RepID=UPI00313945B8